VKPPCYSRSIAVGLLFSLHVSAHAVSFGASDFRDGIAKVSTDYKFCALVDADGKKISTPQYDDVGFIGDGMIAVKKNGKWGYIDKTGHQVVSPQFEYGYTFSEGLAAVQAKNGKYGYIDKAGKLVIPAKFDSVYSFSEGLAAVSVKGKRGFIDKAGAFVIQPKFLFADEFKEGLARVSLDNDDEMGYIDATGAMVIPPKPYRAQSFKDGMAMIEVNGMGGFIDKAGGVVIEPRFHGVSGFSEGLASVHSNGKYGFIDKTGAMVIQPQYDEVMDFSNGAAPVKVGEKWSYIDRAGKLALKPYLDSAFPFSEGVALVSVDGNAGFISPNWKWVISPDDLRTEFQSCGDAAAKQKLVEEAKQRKEQQELITNWRKRLTEGEETNCGPVVEVKGKLVKVAFAVANYGNEHWIRRDQILPTSYDCRFINGQYQATE